MNYVYAGPTGINLGRFGIVTQGQILDFTDQEISKLGGNANFFPVPVPGHTPTGAAKIPLFKTANYTLVTVTDSGRLIGCDHGAAITITLPATPTKGDDFELQFTDDAVVAAFNVTVSRNGSTIDGAASDFTLTPAITRKGFYWNGATWVSY